VGREITTRAQADVILEVVYPITAMIELGDDIAIKAARIIAEAVDEARATP
jgi:hypothetical protein